MVRSSTAVAGVRFLTLAGAGFVALAVWRLYTLSVTGAPALANVPSHLLVIGLGVGLAVGSYRFPAREYAPDLAVRVVGWSLGGFALLAAVVGLFAVSSPGGLSRPVYTGLLGATLGTVGGFAIGVHEVRALSRAREARAVRAELEETVAELERQDDRLEAFASLVSHDLRNPLNVASGRLEMARAECESDQLDAVADELGRMNQLIEDTLAFAREGQTVEEVHRIALAELCREAWSVVPSKAAELKLDDPGTVAADRGRLTRVFENLFRNAVEHGGEDVTVTVGQLEDREGFFVEDDGPGIPSEQRETVLQSGYTTKPDGTGYGLAIVEQIADAHGWAVSVTEGSAGGARFEFAVSQSDPDS